MPNKHVCNAGTILTLPEWVQVPCIFHSLNTFWVCVYLRLYLSFLKIPLLKTEYIRNPPVTFEHAHRPTYTVQH